MGKISQVVRVFSFRLWLRIAAGVFLLLLGIVLGPLPGPGLLIFLSGLVVLGFTIDDVVDVCRKIIPGFDERMANSILSKPWPRPFRRKQRVSLRRRGSESKDEGSS